MKNKVYLLQLEWRVDGVTEFEVQHTFNSMEVAKKYFQKERNNIINDYAKYDKDNFIIEKDTETFFEYQLDDWDKYYILSILEKEVIYE